jgi:hypothetical protein
LWPSEQPEGTQIKTHQIFNAEPYYLSGLFFTMIMDQPEEQEIAL